MIFLLGVCSYFIGSIPFSYLIPRWIGKIDIRRHGSGNTGTTNVVRTLGLKVGVLAFLGDFLKGVIPALIGLLWLGELGGVVGGALAVIGHCHPVWLKFKGGKGVATSAGILLVLFPDIVVILVVVQALIIGFTRYMSLASIISAVLLPILAIVFSKSTLFILFSFLLAIYVIFRHRSNLKRLINGTETKLNFKKK
ncbi:glycerol-3-phosphate 1-O-acyltransferase PlsY [Fusibacter bizertensis]|uniref:Glycerol-3-phosphate acyltransferase n=1 Tax=Fusibacter bizertensis TaxID=1488331 RepID=A0ABT6ND99_9FIRM|nr:glycerol-3-phosphate 1-O-acyltransferase PlsY [Fusibacter bizertensis]MDH8678387.1 glycerol-3-phosphate 1-O-acyltransferase PlsY [Fusibacter bizertensis]